MPIDPEAILDAAIVELNKEAEAGGFAGSAEFESRAREVLSRLIRAAGGFPEAASAQDFPDFVYDAWGVEIKFTKEDKWRTVANSVFEGHRGSDVGSVYVLYGKQGGKPEVRWARYEDCIVHVRTSHRPRFEVEIGTREPLFNNKISLAYEEFRSLDEPSKMRELRRYAKSRMKPGDEQLWWMGEDPNAPHAMELSVKLYMSLDQREKRMLRAQAALLCPEVVKPPRSKKKYDGAALFLLTYHGVLASQARDLFSAGSVAHRGNKTRGGNYVLNALRDIEDELLEAAQTLEDRLFEEYWGEIVPPDERIAAWLKRADALAKSWKPSDVLFLPKKGRKPAKHR